MENFKIRASASGKIMGIKGLGKTGESYCQEWLKEQIYGRKKKFSSRYTEKGLITEDDSIDFIAEHLGYGMLLKNEDYFENDYCKGTPDIILQDHLIDVKNSYDCFTFPMWYYAVPNKDYYWQAQCYMELTGRDKYKLIYILMDTPEHLIEKEFAYNNDMELEYDEFRKDYLYSHIDPKYRIKIFTINKSDSDVAKLKERVNDCRKYIKTLI